ncbi:hypothetical protein [Metabacillus malikii]|uniref:Phage abortive infection protein n=1 Tax=Metabacillus malikii TaxID=1504265 RepID=A0ABT9ZLA1_9BACI|nr:hypothetical protein [Metabacillus malikii]MDQ0232770.1 hypothetical protein [Metabacillus malikii]
MKIPKLYYPYILVAILGAISVVICIEIFPIKTTADLVNFIVTFLSLVIAFIAFIIATQTYISIDSVNVISQMEGNVLENENYEMSITSLLKDYKMKEADEVGEAIFKKLEALFTKKPKTAIEFADNLQYFIDIIVFFPALYHSNDDKDKQKISARMDRILLLIEKRKNALIRVSTGNLILIEETVKLIRSVMYYQRLVSKNQFDITSTLLDVRGKMLKNSVTQTVYYNYLGLFYNKKAMAILNKKLNLHGDFFEINRLSNIIDKIGTLSNEDNELFIMYLLESKKAFKKALENCNEDLMWEGFIKYNDARSTFFLHLLNIDESHQNWEVTINEAIIARSKLNILIADTLDTDCSTHLQESFIYQEYLARLVKMNIKIAKKQHITNTLNVVNYQYPSYDGLLEDKVIKTPYTGNYDKIREYQIGIQEYLS